MVKKRAPIPKRTFKKTYIREWRDSKNLTLDRMVERLETLHNFETTSASLSRIERGEQPYSQEILEALADALGCTAADLIMRPPGSEDELRLVWSQLSPAKQQQALGIIKLLREGAA